MLYTDHLEDARRFYERLGLGFVREQHGSGPAHWAATLDDGTVLELYPATARRAASSSRLGLAVAAADAVPPLPAGRHELTDPDGRIVEVHAV